MIAQQRPLTSTERIFSYLCVYIQQHRYAPTIREIASACTLSISNVVYHLAKLEDQGRIRRDYAVARGIVLLEECHAEDTY